MKSLSKAFTGALLQRSPIQVGLQILIVFAYLCFRLLLDHNMGGNGWNEVDVLPLAKHYADPQWVAKDWYLNQPPGYRFIFMALFGWIAVHWGFLATSILGRMVCYALVATGLVLLGRKLGLTPPALLLAVALFVWQGNSQGAIAGEWLVGGLETKAIAYGLLLLGLWLLVAERYCWMALLLGISTSFHVLIGGWAFLVAGAWLLLNRQLQSRGWKYTGALLLSFLLGSSFAVGSVIQQLTEPTPAIANGLKPSYIYVFLRLPHHLNPAAWPLVDWLRPLLFLLVLLTCAALLWRVRGLPEQAPSPQANAARIALFQFTLLSLVPFGLGLAIAPFDHQGQFLQYYLFRLGDVMLPLTTVLLAVCVLQSVLADQPQVVLRVCVMLLSLNVFLHLPDLNTYVQKLSEFPSTQQSITSEQEKFYAWIRKSTPKQATFITPPGNWPEFTWLAERSIVANYKLFPQTKTGIAEWYTRMIDLSQHPKLGLAEATSFAQELDDGYIALNTQQAIALMKKYKARYFATKAGHSLDLPVAYQNTEFVLYQRRQNPNP